MNLNTDIDVESTTEQQVVPPVHPQEQTEVTAPPTEVDSVPAAAGKGACDGEGAAMKPSLH